MKWIALAMMLLGSTLAQVSQVSQPAIDIGMELRLGMSRDAIIARLAANHKLLKVGDGDDWLVQDKGDDQATTLGQLGFHAGKLTYASRYWTQGTEDAYGFAQVLHGAMAQMESEGRSTCSFDVPTSRSPIAEMKWIRFYCGPKRIEITTTNMLSGAAKGRFVYVKEILSSEKKR